MDYTITKLSPELYYVRWLEAPQIGSSSERQYITDIHVILDETPMPIFVISDLRQGRISNAMVLRELGKLANHPKIAGSTGFSSDPVTSLMMGVFKQYANRVLRGTDHQTWETPEEAIVYLERLKPGITMDIEWDQIIGNGKA